MRRRFLAMLIIVAAMPAAALELINVTTAQQVNDKSQPLDNTETFSASVEEINAVAEFAEVQQTSSISGTWVAVDAINIPNYEIASTTLTLEPGMTLAHFSLGQPTNGWPTGNYEVVIAVDGNELARLPFVISSNAPPANVASSATQTADFGAQSAAPTVVGNWQCQARAMGMTLGQVQASFDENGNASLAGERYTYEVVSDTQLQLRGMFSKHNYKYELQGNDLDMRFRGQRFICSRQVARQGGPASRPGGGNQQASGGGQAWMLNGTFCAYSGSATTNTNYSTESFLTFDGRGNWSMSSATSLNTGIDSYIGESGGPGGTYQVMGNRIQYRTHMGEQGVAEVYMQQTSGEITEIKIDGQLYSPELCDY